MERIDEACDDVFRSGVVRDDSPFLLRERKRVTGKERFYRIDSCFTDVWNIEQAGTIEL
jgi:hypothetical protein